MHRLFLVLLPGAAGIAAVLAGCSSYEPEVLGVSPLELRYLQSDGTRSEEIVLELEVRDEDGFSELDRVYVVQDEAELFWELPSESWHSRPSEGKIRILRLAPPVDEPLPRGRYRVELFDLGGRSGAGSFTLSLLPEAGRLDALEERVVRAGQHVRELLTGAPVDEELPEEPPGREDLRDIGLLFFPAGGGAPENLLNLESLGERSPAERGKIVSNTLEDVALESGRLHVASRAGEAGPVVLLELPDIPN